MRLFTHLISFLCILLFSGCASIVSKSTWPFAVDSNPAGATVVVTNRSGQEVFKGKTPTAIKLKSGAGFFTKESYVVPLTMGGYETKKVNVECRLNGWYFGNIVFGGLIGMLIVDPATGAMFKLDNPGIYETLHANTQTTSTSPTLNILDKNQLPEGWEKHLVKIN